MKLRGHEYEMSYLNADYEVFLMDDLFIFLNHELVISMAERKGE